MKILVTGGGKAGSWVVRGEQLGHAIGASVIPNATLADCRAHDVVVLVKRARPDLALALRKCGRPVVWDVLDVWPQPRGNRWSREELMAYVHSEAQAVGATHLVGATMRMAEDIEADFALHHHGWARGVALVREQVRTVGYEGAAKYVDGWRAAVESECARRGWAFVVNPADYLACDIVLALRDEDANGYAPRCWKSNIKQANAHIAGLPFVAARESGYVETSSGRDFYVDRPADLAEAFEWLTPQRVRQQVQAANLSAALTLDTVAARYRGWLCTLTR